MKFRHLIFCICLGLFGFVFASISDGDTAYDANDFASAIEFYQTAYDSNPNVEALYKLAKATTELAGTLDDPKEAEVLYKQAVEFAKEAIVLDPNEAEAHFELGRAVGRLAQFKGVLESLNLSSDIKNSFEKTLELNPNHAGALHGLAMWNLEVPWIAGGRSSDMKTFFERAIAVEPDIPTHYVEYAAALIRLNEPEAAIALLEQVLSFTPENIGQEKDLEKGQALLDSLD